MKLNFKKKLAIGLSFVFLLGCFTSSFIDFGVSKDLKGQINNTENVENANSKDLDNGSQTKFSDESKLSYTNTNINREMYYGGTNINPVIADVNDYGLYKTSTNDVVKLTIASDSSAENVMNIAFSYDGKDTFVLRDTYYLEYDVLMEGNFIGAGQIDIQAANGNYSLSDGEYAYDMEGIKANTTSSLGSLASNKWYKRKIRITKELSGKKLFQWTVQQKNNISNQITNTYFNNIRITDSNGNVVFAPNLNKTSLMSKAIQKSGVKEYSLKMSKLSNSAVYPRGDYLRFLISNDETTSSQSSYIAYAFSKTGMGTYKIKQGDVLVYKVKSVDPFIKGSGSVDLRFTDKTWLTDIKTTIDMGGLSIYPSTDLSSQSGGKWYYRAITLPSQVIGKVIDYSVFKALNSSSLKNYETQLADVKILNQDKTSLLIYGGGDPNYAGLVASRSASVSVNRNHSSSDVGSPSGDYIKGTIYSNRIDRLSSVVRFSQSKYTIQPGDYLEYDITTFDSRLPSSGFAVDIGFESDEKVKFSGWKDQNAISGTAGIDISSNTAGKWHHRKISLDNSASETINSWSLDGQIASSESAYPDGKYFNYGFDNIKITNKGVVKFTAYSNGKINENTILRRANCEMTTISSTPLNVPTPLYTVPSTTLPSNDYPVITYNVMAFGAKGDGNTDDTNAFQSALYATEKIGGGVVFAPSGKYVIKSRLYIPMSVQLRGEWQTPTGLTAKGTILLAYEGKDDISWNSFISINRDGSLSNIAVWYPEQNINSISEYPWTIQSHYGETEGKNITLFNSYRGFKFGNGTSGSHLYENIYGTYLSRGIEIDCNFDFPRFNNLYSNPDTWVSSGLSNAPKSAGIASLKNFMTSNLEYIRSGRVDALTLYNINIDYAKTGILYDIARNIEPLTISEGGAFGSVTNINISNVNTGICINAVSGIGVTVSKGSIQANQGVNPIAIKTAETFTTYTGFSDIILSGTSNLIEANGNGMLSLQNIVFDSWGNNKYAMVGNAGLMNMNGSDFKQSSKHINLTSNFKGATINGNKYDSIKDISIDPTITTLITQTDGIMPFEIIGDAAVHNNKIAPKAGKSTVYNVRKYGAKADGITDDTDAIQLAVDAAFNDGGGIVYLPAGEYAIYGNIDVKSKVELRGAMASIHHSVGGSTVLRIFGGKGNANAKETITLQSNAGISGLTFYYPEQLTWSTHAYPWAVKSNGDGVYAINSTFVNAYQGIDFFTNSSDKHFISGVMGAFISKGIFVGKSETYGTIQNTHMVIHFWTAYPAYGCIKETGDVTATLVFKITAKNLISYQFGDCKNESVLANFSWISNTNIRFVDQGMGGFKGKFINPGTDGSYTSLDVIKAEDIAFVTPFMYVHGQDKYSSVRTYINSHITNTGKVRIFNVCGNQNGFPLDAFLIYNGNITIQQIGSDSAKNFNANIKGGNVKLINISMRPCTPVYGGGNPTDINISRDVRKVIIIGWINEDKGAVKIVNGAGDKFTGIGIVSLNKNIV